MRSMVSTFRSSPTGRLRRDPGDEDVADSQVGERIGLARERHAVGQHGLDRGDGRAGEDVRPGGDNDAAREPGVRLGGHNGGTGAHRDARAVRQSGESDASPRPARARVAVPANPQAWRPMDQQ